MFKLGYNIPMNKKIILITILIIVAAAIMLFRGGGEESLISSEGSDRNPTSADDAPAGSIHNLPVPKAVSEVKKYVALDENISEGLVIIMTAYEKTWTNGCLDLATKDEMCTEALVPGYEVSVQAGKGIRVFHTNEDGSQIRERE